MQEIVKICQILLASALFASGLVSVWLVATDGWLRTVAPSHEYGLLVFGFLDLVLLLTVFVTPKLADLGAFLVAIIQLSAMLGDAYTFAPAGTLQVAFRAYLLSDAGFVASMGLQVVLACLTAIMMALLHEAGRPPHGAHSFSLRRT